MQKQRHYFVNKGSSRQGYGFSSDHVWMWELDCEESWAPKNWCFWTVVLEKTLESLLDCKETQPVHSEDQPWDFFGRTDAKAEAPVLWPPDVKSWLTGKDSVAGKYWRQEEKGWQKMRWLDSIIDSTDMSFSKLWERVKNREAWHAAGHGVAKSQTWLRDWTTTRFQCDQCSNKRKACFTLPGKVLMIFRRWGLYTGSWSITKRLWGREKAKEYYLWSNRLSCWETNHQMLLEKRRSGVR